MKEGVKEKIIKFLQSKDPEMRQLGLTMLREIKMTSDERTDLINKMRKPYSDERGYKFTVNWDIVFNILNMDTYEKDKKRPQSRRKGIGHDKE